MIGLIGSSIISGLIVSRTGRYKWLIVGSVAVMGFAVFLMTQLTKDTPVPMVWLWMFIAGLGVGPTFSVRRSSSRTPCRSASSASRPRTSRSSARSAAPIALAFVGTIFGDDVHRSSSFPRSARRACRSRSSTGSARRAASGSSTSITLTGVGDLGAAILPRCPRSPGRRRSRSSRRSSRASTGRSASRPPRPSGSACSASIVAVVAAVAIKEIPLRTSNEQPVPAEAPAAGAGRGAVRSPRRGPQPEPAVRPTDRPRTTLGPVARGGRAVPCPLVAGYHRRVTAVLPFPPARSRSGAGDAAVPGHDPGSPSCRRARCAGSRWATSTSCSPTPTSGSSRSTTAARTCRPRCRSASWTAASSPAPSTPAASTSRSGEPVQMPTTGGLGPTAATTRPGRQPGREPKDDPPGKKAEARRLTRVRRFRYYPVRIVDGVDRGRGPRLSGGRAA